MRMKRAMFGAALILAALASACVEPDNSYLMELNRNGKWVEAERLGERMLAKGSAEGAASGGSSQGEQGGQAKGDSLSPEARGRACETMFHVAYAKARLGKRDEAAALVGSLDGLRLSGPIDPKLLWLDAESARLKAELGLLSEAQRTLVAAMEANAKGDHAEARGLCLKALAIGGDDALGATANLVAAACSIRLGDAKAAEGFLAAYERLRPSLPPGHRALVDEAAVRQALADLAQPASR